MDAGGDFFRVAGLGRIPDRHDDFTLEWAGLLVGLISWIYVDHLVHRLA